MKKLITLTLIAAMTMSLVACGGKGNENTTKEPTTPEQTTMDNSAATPGGDVAVPGGDEMPGLDGGEMPGLDDEFGDYTPVEVAPLITDAFKNLATDDKTAETVVDELLSSETIVDLGLALVPVQEGLLTGFDNYEVKGFSEGTMFAPMISVIPFVGYVFVVEDDADEFAEDLKEHCNPRWNVCTEAEVTEVLVQGNKVLFLMCPTEY